MGIESKSVDYAKELDELLFAMEELLKDVKDGKDVSAIAAENLPNVIAAVDKMDQVDDERRSDKDAWYATAGYRLGKIIGIFA